MPAIRETDDQGNVIKAGFEWKNPVENRWAAHFSWINVIGMVIGGFLFLGLRSFMDSFNIAGHAWSQTSGGARALPVFIAFGFWGLSALMIIMAYTRKWRRSRVTFTREKAHVDTHDLDRSLDLNAISSIEEAPEMNMGGGQFMMTDPRNHRARYPAYSVRLFLGDGKSIVAGENLQTADSRIVVAQLNEALALMRQAKATSHLEGSEHW